jgi:hypothetical protein
MANPNETKNVGKMLRALVMLMGANIVAPKELKDMKLAELKVENNEPLANILIDMNNLDENEKLTIVKAIVVSTLKPIQCIHLAEYVRNHMNDIVQYANVHEEVKEKVSPEDLLNMENEL